MFVAGIDVSELSLLFETRTVLEPYAARLAAARGTEEHWSGMQEALDAAQSADTGELMAIDHRCHELMWDAAGNRFLLDTLDGLVRPERSVVAPLPQRRGRHERSGGENTVSCSTASAVATETVLQISWKNTCDRSTTKSGRLSLPASLRLSPSWDHTGTGVD